VGQPQILTAIADCANFSGEWQPEHIEKPGPARIMGHLLFTLLQSGKEPGCRLGRANPPGPRKEINDVFTLEVVEDCPVCLCAYCDGGRGIGRSIV
jgi:hypothetical protein